MHLALISVCIEIYTMCVFIEMSNTTAQSPCEPGDLYEVFDQGIYVSDQV